MNPPFCLFLYRQHPAILTKIAKLTPKTINLTSNAVIGFSNTDLTDLIDPPLSVIRQPAFEMGEAATELLLSLIKSKKPVTKFETRIHTTELIVKKST